MRSNIRVFITSHTMAQPSRPYDSLYGASTTPPWTHAHLDDINLDCSALISLDLPLLLQTRITQCQVLGTITGSSLLGF
jgi:hypothetical protein